MLKSREEPLERLSIENAKIIFRNFSGAQGQYNPEGVRNFCVILDPDVADILEKDGWNIKRKPARDPQDPPLIFTSIKVSYAGKFPPIIVLITKRKKTTLKEKDINLLDWAEIVSCDIIINPYRWEKGKEHGIKGYLSKLYVTIREDEFAEKYEDVPDSAMSAFDKEDEG